jgi:hypothetical protein
MRSIARARSRGVLRGHGPSSNARRAAAIAFSTSATLASGAFPMISSVAGFGTAYSAPPAACVHAPSMSMRPVCTIVPLCVRRDGRARGLF